ncbi:hypothetical protein LHK59_12855, partial [Staphylococcus argenteus]|nr:hypothetical protein [Staphylococcus argenteus]
EADEKLADINVQVGGAPTQKLTKSQLTLMCKLGCGPHHRKFQIEFYKQCELLGWDKDKEILFL